MIFFIFFLIFLLNFDIFLIFYLILDHFFYFKFQSCAYFLIYNNHHSLIGFIFINFNYSKYIFNIDKNKKIKIFIIN